MRTEDLQDRLQLVGRRDLYEFLRMSRDSRPEALQERARQIVNSIRSKGERGLKAEARRELAEACQGVFRNARTKREYDQTLPRVGGGGIRTLAPRAAVLLLSAGIVACAVWLGQRMDVWPDGASSDDGRTAAQESGDGPRSAEEIATPQATTNPAPPPRRPNEAAGTGPSGVSLATATGDETSAAVPEADAGQTVATVSAAPVAVDTVGDASEPDRAIFDIAAPEAPEQETAAEPVRVGGNVTAPTKLHHVPPVYPRAARARRVQGVVILETVIGTSGGVDGVRVLRSIPLLDDAAIEAVRQWRYTPTLLNGVPQPVIMTVTVNFELD